MLEGPLFRAAAARVQVIDDQGNFHFFTPAPRMSSNRDDLPAAVPAAHALRRPIRVSQHLVAMRQSAAAVEDLSDRFPVSGPRSAGTNAARSCARAASPSRRRARVVEQDPHRAGHLRVVGRVVDQEHVFAVAEHLARPVVTARDQRQAAGGRLEHDEAARIVVGRMDVAVGGGVVGQRIVDPPRKDDLLAQAQAGDVAPPGIDVLAADDHQPHFAPGGLQSPHRRAAAWPRP